MKITIKEDGREREVELSEESAQALKKAFREEKKGLWKPEEGDEYWYMSDGGRSPAHWDDGSTDNGRYITGNVFPTQEAAQKEIEKRKAIHRVKEYIAKEFGEFEPDWENRGQRKFQLDYGYSSKSMLIEWHVMKKVYSPFGYLRNGEHCEQLITDMEDDLKIIFEVE
jgi:hypothetical protein